MNDIVVYGRTRPGIAVPLAVEADAMIDPMDVSPQHHRRVRFWYDPVNSVPDEGLLVGICGTESLESDGDWHVAELDGSVEVDVHPAVVDPSSGESHSVIRSPSSTAMLDRYGIGDVLRADHLGAVPHQQALERTMQHLAPLYNFSQRFLADRARDVESFWVREARNREMAGRRE